MPTNIEIKAHARDESRQRQLAAALATAPTEELDQIDTFFVVPTGRLKLRQISPTFGQLVRYHRPNIPGPKSSEYSLFPTDRPALLRDMLAESLGILGQVRKHRTVYHAGQTRIHFDNVEGLGAFLELEVVLRAGQTSTEGHSIARDIMRQLDIREADLLHGAYLDLLSTTAKP